MKGENLLAAVITSRYLPGNKGRQLERYRGCHSRGDTGICPVHILEEPGRKGKLLKFVIFTLYVLGFLDYLYNFLAWQVIICQMITDA